MTKPQNHVSSGIFQGKDPSVLERILPVVLDRSGFTLESEKETSRWWNSTSIGAVSFAGVWQGTPAILKIQLVQHPSSESELITQFHKNNQSHLVRPPHLYWSMSWDDELMLEAMIIEEVKGPSLIDEADLESGIKRFFEVILDYRVHCLSVPFVDQPNVTSGELISTQYSTWRRIAKEQFPNHPLQTEADHTLIDQAVEMLTQAYGSIPLEFVHGHLSVRDLKKVGDQIVVLSNLYWGFRPPLYDAVFAAHWHLLSMASMGISESEWLSAKRLWRDQLEVYASNIFSVPGHLELSLIERTLAAFNLDSLNLNPNSPTTRFVLDEYRKELIDWLEKSATKTPPVA